MRSGARTPAAGLRRAEGLLLLAAAIWGFAFVAQKSAMADIGPFTFNGIRFALGALALSPWAFRKRARRVPASTGSASSRLPLLPWGLLAGGVLFAGASLQQIGIVTTTAGKAGFITGLYVLLVPILGAFLGRAPGAGTWAGALLATGGLFLLSGAGRGPFARGDLLVLASAGAFAAHVLLIGWLSGERGAEAVPLACLQYAACAALSLAAAASAEEIAPGPVYRAALPILYGGILSVGVAYTLQVAGQRSAPPAHAAILLGLEGVFAAIAGALFLGERWTAPALAGSALMVAGTLLSERSAIARAAAAASTGISRRSPPGPGP
jgi:drug/metabolite transporter (DMT)-like permease